jgi:alpha-tubulin suppressor-like RCC1 family protein
MKHGDLYGWGEAEYLGIEDLKDRSENVIKDFANPIVVTAGIESVTAGAEHTVAITKDKRVLAWGNARAFSNTSVGFARRPMDVT